MALPRAAPPRASAASRIEVLGGGGGQEQSGGHSDQLVGRRTNEKKEGRMGLFVKDREPVPASKVVLTPIVTLTLGLTTQ